MKITKKDIGREFTRYSDNKQFEIIDVYITKNAKNEEVNRSVVCRSYCIDQPVVCAMPVTTVVRSLLRMEAKK